LPGSLHAAAFQVTIADVIGQSFSPPAWVITNTTPFNTLALHHRLVVITSWSGSMAHCRQCHQQYHY